MKTLVGIDAQGNYQKALTLLKRLDFTDQHLELLHALEMGANGMVPGILAPVYNPTGGMSGLDEAGTRLLNQAKERATILGMEATTCFSIGSAHAELLWHADETHPDLIAIGPPKHQGLEGVLYGSVTRALTHRARPSLLIARGEIADAGGVTAVFGTDLSPYSERAARLLAHFAPKGVGRIIVVHADHQRAVSRQFGRGGATCVEERTLAKTLMERTRAVGRILQNTGAEIVPMVVDADPQEAIADAAHQFNADLVILGARGHNLIERLFLGSVSAQEAAKGDRSLLILRA